MGVKECAKGYIPGRLVYHPVRCCRSVGIPKQGLGGFKTPLQHTGFFSQSKELVACNYHYFKTCLYSENQPQTRTRMRLVHLSFVQRWCLGKLMAPQMRYDATFSSARVVRAMHKGLFCLTKWFAQHFWQRRHECERNLCPAIDFRVAQGCTDDRCTNIIVVG